MENKRCFTFSLFTRACILIALYLAILNNIACNSGSKIESKYIGEWVDVKDSHVFVKIYRDGNALIWENYMGDKYPAKLENGQLIVSGGSISLTLQYIESTDRLIAPGGEFSRKRG